MAVEHLLQPDLIQIVIRGGREAASGVAR